MALLSVGSHLLVVGKTGSGKSVWARRVLFSQLMKIPKQVLVIIDPKQEFGDLGAVDVHSAEQLNRELYGTRLRVMNTKSRPRLLRVLVNYPAMETAERLLRAAWGPFQATAQKSAAFPLRIYIEDAPNFYRERGGDDPPEFTRWLTTGRAFNRTLAIAGQRTQLLPKLAFQAEVVVAFRLTNYDVVTTISRYYGAPVVSAMASLPRYGYLVISDLLEDDFATYAPLEGVKEIKLPGVDL